MITSGKIFLPSFEVAKISSVSSIFFSFFFFFYFLELDDGKSSNIEPVSPNNHLSIAWLSFSLSKMLSLALLYRKIGHPLLKLLFPPEKIFRDCICFAFACIQYIYLHDIRARLVKKTGVGRWWNFKSQQGPTTQNHYEL